MVRCCSWVAVLTRVTSTFVPLVGRLVDESQEGMEKGVTGEEEEDKDQKPQHEDDTGKGQEQMLERKSKWFQLNMRDKIGNKHDCRQYMIHIVSPVQQTEALLAAAGRTHLYNWPSEALTAVLHETACLLLVRQCRLPWHTHWRGKAGSSVCSEHRCSCSPRHSGGQTVGHTCCRLLEMRQCLQ